MAKIEKVSEDNKLSLNSNKEIYECPLVPEEVLQNKKAMVIKINRSMLPLRKKLGMMCSYISFI